MAYRFQLFINGESPQGTTAVANFERLRLKLSGEGHELQVIDVLKQPHLAEQYRLLATPTLIKSDPPPVRRVIGDLSDVRAVANALGLELPSDSF